MTGRTCDSCTACCDGWLQIEVRGHAVLRGKPCPFSVEHQCSIYDERPQHPCREFICGWLMPSSPLPEWMRPDKSDMIMLASNFIWQGWPVDVVVAVGDRPKKKALEWLQKFSREKKRLLIYQISRIGSRSGHLHFSPISASALDAARNFGRIENCNPFRFSRAVRGRWFALQTTKNCITARQYRITDG